MTDFHAFHLTIQGRVQGVGYRRSLHQEATRLGLSGWVRNRLTGDVEALVCGNETQVGQLLAWARQGPPAARVDGIVSTPASPTTDAGFHIRPTE